jgi:hypothetical protein
VRRPRPSQLDQRGGHRLDRPRIALIPAVASASQIHRSRRPLRGESPLRRHGSRVERLVDLGEGLRFKGELPNIPMRGHGICPPSYEGFLALVNLALKLPRVEPMEDFIDPELWEEKMAPIWRLRDDLITAAIEATDKRQAAEAQNNTSNPA